MSDDIISKKGEVIGQWNGDDVADLQKILASARQTLRKNKDKVDQYKAGKEKLFGFFVGEVMKLSSGKANPQLTNEILKKILKG